MPFIRGEQHASCCVVRGKAMQIYVVSEFHWPEQLRASNSVEAI